MSDMSKREFETVLAYFQAKIVCSDMNGAPCILHKIARICRFLGNLYSKKFKINQSEMAFRP